MHAPLILTLTLTLTHPHPKVHAPAPLVSDEAYEGYGVFRFEAIDLS